MAVASLPPGSLRIRRLFRAYTDYLWIHENKPDVVLIDGRFRVSAFLTCLKNADAGTSIIFDDYTIREYYQVVEEFAPRVETCGRQCLFVAPGAGDLDLERLDREIAAFRFVID